MTNENSACLANPAFCVLNTTVVWFWFAQHSYGQLGRLYDEHTSFMNCINVTFLHTFKLRQTWMVDKQIDALFHVPWSMPLCQLRYSNTSGLISGCRRPEPYLNTNEKETVTCCPGISLSPMALWNTDAVHLCIDNFWTST